MNDIKLQPINSSNLIEARHDGTNKCHVRFKGGALYENTVPVPPEKYAEFEKTFQDAASSGSHFHKNMKQYGFKKIG